MMKQEPVDEGKKPFRRRLAGMIARVSRVGFHVVWLLLILACTGAWIASYRGGYYNYEVDLYSLHRNGSSTIFYRRGAGCDFMRGEAIFQIGKTFWDQAPTAPFPAIHVEGEQVPYPDGFMLPEKGWHQFRYDTYSEPPDSFSHSLGNSGVAVALPLWTVFAFLLIPFLILVVHRASRKIIENRRGFAPILKR